MSVKIERERTVSVVPPAPADTRMATLRAIYIIWYRDLLRYWRDRWRLVASLAQPLLFLIVFGSGLSSALGGGSVFGTSGGISYIQFMYPGIIGMAILFTAIFGAMSIVWDREFGFLKEVLVAPIDPARFRFNIGVRTLTSGASITVTVRNAEGAVTRTVSKTYPATFFQQGTATDVLGAPLNANDSITISVDSGSLVVYGATADNTTQDPSLQLAKKVI